MNPKHELTYLENKKYLDYDDDVKWIIKNLKLGDEKIDLVGSASLKQLKYAVDYDFMSFIEKNYEKKEFDDNFVGILKKLSKKTHYYFLELKFQYKDDKKIKIRDLNKAFHSFSKNYNKKLQFVKIDFVIFKYNIFREVSIIYDLSKKEINVEELIKNIQEDIKEQIKDEKYFKVLKRYLSIYKLENNAKIVKKITKLLNSDVGKLYFVVGNLETLIRVDETYPENNNIKKMINTDLEKIGLGEYNINDLEKIKEKEEKSLKEKSKILYNAFIKEIS